MYNTNYTYQDWSMSYEEYLRGHICWKGGHQGSYVDSQYDLNLAHMTFPLPSGVEVALQ